MMPVRTGPSASASACVGVVSHQRSMGASGSPARAWGALSLLATLVVQVPGYAEPAPKDNAVAPHATSSPKPKTNSEVATSAASTGPKSNGTKSRAFAGAKGQNVAHKGPAPKQPSPQLPEGASRPQPNQEARRTIAGGPTDDERVAPLDAELQVLREAERALFPRPLQGVHPGWSWDLENSTAEPEGAPGTSIVPPELAPQPATRSSTEVGKWLSELTLPNLPTSLQPTVVTYLQFYRTNAQGKSILRTWFKKSGRYSKIVTAELAKAGLPTDLQWQSIIESGFNPAAKSPAGAVGLWQFMPETARAYGLQVDRWTDERLDPQRATEAASRLLADLHRRFGNWELALAAYNMGHAGLSRAIRKYNSNDFWLLTHYESGLPWETTLYVPKIIALAIAMNNRVAFGLDDLEPDAPVQFDVISVGPGQPLAAVAKAAGVNESTICELNPQFLAGRTPPTAQGQKATSYSIRVPSGTGAIVSRKIAALGAADADFDVYTIRQGDTLDSVARAIGVTVADLKALNQVAQGEILVPGDSLLVPRRDRPSDVDFAEDERVVVVPRNVQPPAGARRVFYRVVPGDTLSGIAKSFGVRRSELLEWNSIDTTARLQAKMVLSIWLPEDSSPPKARFLASSDARVLIAGSQEFAEYFEALRGNDRVVVHARQGDTLVSIASRYKVNVATLERVNRRSRTARMGEGEPIVVYVPRANKGPKNPKAPAEAAKAPSTLEAAEKIPVSTSKPVQGMPVPDSG